MKLLLDANLSWRLVAILEREFPGIKHIVTAGLNHASSDTTVWNYAKQNDYAIVTNDDDFYFLSLGKNFPPKIILLRTGNQTTKYLGEILLKHKKEILEFGSNPDLGILEIY